MIIAVDSAATSCAYRTRLVASSTTAIKVCRSAGRRASQACGLPSMCSSSPKQGRGSRRRRWRPRGRRVASGLQEAFYERVAVGHAMLALGNLVKVRRIEPGVLLAIEPGNAGHFLHARAPW